MFISVDRMCEETGWGRPKIRELRMREDDPLPFRTLDGKQRYCVALESELEEWFKRNTHINEKN